MEFVFGSGVFWGTPLTNASGVAITNPTPVQFAILQDISIDISFDVKELYGQNQFPVAIGRGKGKIAGKAKAAQIFGAGLNSLVFGQTTTQGTLTTDFFDVTGSAIPGTPFTVTVVPPNSGTFVYDLGVRNSNGVPLTRVAASPTTGQYTQTGAAYLFAAADTGTTVFISYQYTSSSVPALYSDVKNVLMGQAPTFKGDLYLPYAGKSLIMTFPQCLISKLSLATKIDDFMIPEFDWSGFADSNNNALYWSTSE